jgi:hypothetical protein
MRSVPAYTVLNVSTRLCSNAASDPPAAARAFAAMKKYSPRVASPSL